MDRKNWCAVYRCLGFIVIGAVISGCGVKSAPDHPEGAAYPLIYPAPTSAPVGVSGGARPVVPTSPTAPARRQNDDGVYTPPAPATEILAQ